MKPLLHVAIEENPRGQVRVYNADGKLLIGTTGRGYLAELAEAVKEAKAEALEDAAATLHQRVVNPNESTKAAINLLRSRAATERSAS